MVLTRITGAAARALLVGLLVGSWAPGQAAADVETGTVTPVSAAVGSEMPPLELPCSGHPPGAEHCCHPHGPAHAPLPSASGEFERQSPLPAATAALAPWPATGPARRFPGSAAQPASGAGPPLYLLFLQLRN
ncbi:MAG: hypothetical protein ACOZDY_07835 [Pseudomonadota bacterium]